MDHLLLNLNKKMEAIRIRIVPMIAGMTDVKE
jgi:hypothetical protein